MGGALTEERTTVTYGWATWLCALLITLVLGAILNVLAGLLGMSVYKPLTGLFGVIPGIIFVAAGAALKPRWPNFGGGMFVGGCMIALLGGVCGVVLSSN
ncbi:MAG: hypothetical protein QOI24_4245 [Acidobacteriota bacterium]|jgi:hypothetical protein|nr:hypothetical protein [Acidobacteriota bacterium]